MLLFSCDLFPISSNTQNCICASCNLCITRAIQLEACFFFFTFAVQVSCKRAQKCKLTGTGPNQRHSKKVKTLEQDSLSGMRLSQSEKSPIDLRASPICSPPRADWKICKFLVFSAPGSQLKREMINSLCSHRFKKDKIPRFSLFTQVVFYCSNFCSLSRFCLHFILSFYHFIVIDTTAIFKRHSCLPDTR